MFQQNKFDLSGKTPIEDQVQDWTEQFFYNLMNILNSFYSRVSLAETLNSLKGIDFTRLVLEQLEDESDEIKAMASAKVEELARVEIEYMESYSS
ncbi:MAG: hypothetical protein ABRQ26_14495 [Syntrophomonadaceae bacterium]